MEAHPEVRALLLAPRACMRDEHTHMLRACMQDEHTHMHAYVQVGVLLRDLRAYMQDEFGVGVSDRRLVKAVRLLKVAGKRVPKLE